MTFGGFLTGMIMIIIGFFFTKYSDKIAGVAGDIGIGNKLFGGGGAYTLHKVIGIIIIVVGILWSTGGFQYILVKTLGSLFTGTVPKTDTTVSSLIMFFS